MSTLDQGMVRPANESPGTLTVLSVMMFLQYAVWGVWLPIMAKYLTTHPTGGGLGFTGEQVGWILGTAGSLGALTAPLIAGQVADRYLNAERALALLLLLGGVAVFSLAYVRDFNTFLVVSVAYSVLYMPTLSLTNSIAFHNLADAEKQFPIVRVLGTIGWMAASFGFGFFWLGGPDDRAGVARIADAFRVSGVLSVAYAIFALTALPATPPKRDVAHPLAFARALVMLRHPGFLVVTLAALPIAMIHQCYFMRTAPFLSDAVGISLQWVTAVMTLGQLSEIMFLGLLGLFIKRLGYRWVLVMGCSAYFVRYGIFALGEPSGLIVAAQVLHGLCYGCFFAAAFLYVEQIAPLDARHSAQAVFGIIILGVGPILAAFYNAYFDRFKTAAGSQSYTEFWTVQAAIGLACAVLVAVSFPRRRPARMTSLDDSPSHSFAHNN